MKRELLKTYTATRRSTVQSLAIFRAYLAALKLDEAVINEVTARFTLKEYRKGEYFAFAGTVEDKLGFVLDGLFHMHVDDEEGRQVTKEFLSRRRFLLASFDPETESLVSIRALKDSTVMEAAYSDVQTLYSRYPKLESLSRKRAEREYRVLHERLESFIALDAKERYRLFLENFGDIERDIPQYLVASYIGVTPTQLSRIRSRISH